MILKFIIVINDKISYLKEYNLVPKSLYWVTTFYFESIFTVTHSILFKNDL